MGRRLTVILSAAAAVVIFAVYYLASAPDGAELFRRENCVKCHILRGQGLGVRDLTDVAKRRSRAWIRDQIINPRLHNPHPGMPSFAHLSGREMSALIDHLEAE